MICMKDRPSHFISALAGILLIVSVPDLQTQSWLTGFIGQHAHRCCKVIQTSLAPYSNLG